MESKNYWGHKRKMTDDWYKGTTGIPPLDNAIKGAQDYVTRIILMINDFIQRYEYVK